MACEVEFAKVEVLLKCRAKWIRGDINHSHVVLSDEIVRNEISGDLFLGVLFIVRFDLGGASGNSLWLGFVSDAKWQGSIEA